MKRDILGVLLWYVWAVGCAALIGWTLFDAIEKDLLSGLALTPLTAFRYRGKLSKNFPVHQDIACWKRLAHRLAARFGSSPLSWAAHADDHGWSLEEAITRAQDLLRPYR